MQMKNEREITITFYLEMVVWLGLEQMYFMELFKA